MYKKESEAFLARMMSLLVSSHYKNSPNDLQMMADAPSYKIFVLLGPGKGNTDAGGKDLPDIYSVVLVCIYMN